jgi:hypothetical protein
MSAAVISPCNTYRYRLERDVDQLTGGPVFAYFGINPSTADATADDATVRKWIGFTKVFGGSRFIVGNVFAHRATDVGQLATVHQPIGPENFAHLERIARDADVLVACWGDRDKVPRTLQHHIDRVAMFLQICAVEERKPLKAFGFTAGGDPKHPLMPGYDTKLVDWSPHQ